MSKVLYLGSDWLHNVGNNFIDKGAIALLETAGHDVDVYSTSCQDLIIEDKISKKIIEAIPRSIMSEIKPLATSISGSIIEIGQKSSEEVSEETSKALEFPPMISNQYEYVAFAGMRLNPDSLGRLSSILEDLVNNKGMELLILGAGGASYSQKESQFVTDWLKRFSPQLLITRDPDAYECYNGVAQNTFDGLDCAFHINDAIEAPDLNTEYVVKNIDRKQTGKINIQTDREIIKTHHVIDNIPKEYRDGPNTFLSSYPKEYLTIYANADFVVTDRLHACIPTLVFNNKCRYLLDAPKNSLFDRIGISNVTSDVIDPPTDRIKEEKERQVKVLKQNT